MNRSALTKQTTTFFEQLFTNRQGISVRVVFEITYSTGTRHIRVVSVTPVLALQGDVSETTRTPLLSATCSTCSSNAPEILEPVQSPYVSGIERFFTSQMTRAPAYDFLPTI